MEQYEINDIGKLTYTVTKMTGIQGIPTTAELENVGVVKYAGLFELSDVQVNAKGQPYVVVSLKEGVDYPTNVNYNNMRLKFTYDDGTPEGLEVYSQNLSWKTSQTALKLTANPSKQTFYQAQSKDRIVQYQINLTSPACAVISDISVGDIKLWQSALEDQARDIAFDLEPDGRTLIVSVMLKDSAKLVAGKTYTLPVLIKADGAASNVAAAKVNLTLAVQK